MATKVSIPGYILFSVGEPQRRSKRRGEGPCQYGEHGHGPLSGPCPTVATAHKAATAALLRRKKEAERDAAKNL